MYKKIQVLKKRRGEDGYLSYSADRDAKLFVSDRRTIVLRFPTGAHVPPGSKTSHWSPQISSSRLASPSDGRKISFAALAFSKLMHGALVEE